MADRNIYGTIIWNDRFLYEGISPIRQDYFAEIMDYVNQIRDEINLHESLTSNVAHPDVTLTDAGFISPSIVRTIYSIGDRLAELGELNESSVPDGVIVAYAGKPSSSVSGWVLCNGSNSTPNIVNRFVLGGSTASTYALGSTGGSTYDWSSLTGTAALQKHTHSFDNAYCAAEKGATSGTNPVTNKAYQQLTLSTHVAGPHKFDKDNSLMYFKDDEMDYSGSDTTVSTIGDTLPSHIKVPFFMRSATATASATPTSISSDTPVTLASDAATKITLSPWTDYEIDENTPVRLVHLTDLRNNVQSILTALDKHVGAGSDAHAAVTTTSAGFITPEIMDMIDECLADLDDLESWMYDNPGIPPNAIAVWNGDASDIPTGFYKCDGSNGTPDLRYKIPVNWGSGHTFASTGGNTTCSVAIANIIKSHTHTFANCTYGTNVSDYVSENPQYTRYGQLKMDVHANWYYYPFVMTETTSSSGSASSSSGATISVNTLPPYIVKWYIMRGPVTGAAAKETVTVSIVENPYGTILTNVTGTVTIGSRLSVTVIPDENYVLASLYINGSEVANNITMYLYEDAEISAEIYRPSYAFTITQSEHQTITVTCDGEDHTSSFTALKGQTWAATVEAEDGYTAGKLSVSEGTITGKVSISASAAVKSS